MVAKSGAKPRGRVKIEWSSNFAYAIGLLASDGCLYGDELHISLTSNDEDQIKNFIRCLNLGDIKIGKSQSGHTKMYTPRVQFGDVLFYRFLNSIGLTSAKSKTIGELKIPEEYFFDFLRGSFDGDGCFYSYWDPRWRSSHMFYLTFGSASKKHIDWLQVRIFKETNLSGHVSKSQHPRSIYTLRYAKKAALVIIKKMYYNPRVVCLYRKKLKIQKALAIEKKQQKQYT